MYRSRSVDYVIKFEESENNLTSVRACWERKLLKRGLILEHDSDIFSRSVFVKIIVPFSVLLRKAEALNMNLPLNKPLDVAPPHNEWYNKFMALIGFAEAAVPEPSAPLRVNKLAEFRGGEDREPVAGNEPLGRVKRLFFTKAHRSYITYQIVTHTFLSVTEVHRIDNPHCKADRSIGITRMVSQGIYDKFFPLHDGSSKHRNADRDSRARLAKTWGSSSALFKAQPLDDIREYFGERIALYFAFLGFYTTWLWSASLVGVIVFIYGIVNSFDIDNFTASMVTGVSRVFDNALTIPFGAFIAIWATVYLEMWKRKQAYLGWRWDVLDYEEMEDNRPDWYGTKTRISPVTGRVEFHYPSSIRYAKMATSCTCIALAILIVLGSVAGALTYRVWALNYFGECDIVGGDNYGATCANKTSTPIPHVDCNDPCFTFMTSAACNGAPLQYTPTEPDSDVTSCAWIGTDADGWCQPACTSFLTRSQCSLSYYDNYALPGDPYRETCYWTDPYYVSTITAAIINLFAIVVLNELFQYVAKYLNDWENHKTETEYQDALIVKTFFFQFLNSYTSLFYIAFFKGTVARNIFGVPSLRDECDFGSCFTELMIQLAIIFVGKQLLNQVTEVVVPYVINYLKSTSEARNKDAMAVKYAERAKALYSSDLPTDPRDDFSRVPQWVKDENLSPITGLLFDDYNEMALQFGFITLFVVAFPLGPFFALLNNIVEIRTDSYKRLTKYQRPPALIAEDIGTWYVILESLGIMCVITNSFIVAFSSAWVKEMLRGIMHVPPSLTNDEEDAFLLAGRLVIVLVFEHVVIGLKLLIAFMIPDVPGPVRVAIERETYLARIAIDGIADDDDEIEDEEVLKAMLAERKGKRS